MSITRRDFMKLGLVGAGIGALASLGVALPASADTIGKVEDITDAVSISILKTEESNARWTMSSDVEKKAFYGGQGFFIKNPQRNKTYTKPLVVRYVGAGHDGGSRSVDVEVTFDTVRFVYDYDSDGIDGLFAAFMKGQFPNDGGGIQKWDDGLTFKMEDGGEIHFTIRYYYTDTGEEVKGRRSVVVFRDVDWPGYGTTEWGPYSWSGYAESIKPESGVVKTYTSTNSLLKVDSGAYVGTQETTTLDGIWRSGVAFVTNGTFAGTWRGFHCHTLLGLYFEGQSFGGIKLQKSDSAL